METSDYQKMIRQYADYVMLLRSAVKFAEERIKSGKAWDAECEKVFGEALRASGFTFYEQP